MGGICLCSMISGVSAGKIEGWCDWTAGTGIIWSSIHLSDFWARLTQRLGLPTRGLTCGLAMCYYGSCGIVRILTWQPKAPRVVFPMNKRRNCIAFYEPASEAKQHHHSHMPLVEDAATPTPTPIHRKGNRTIPLDEGMVRSHCREISKTGGIAQPSLKSAICPKNPNCFF